MATETIAGPLGEVRAASTAGGGTALTATAVRIPLPRGTKQINLIPRNFTTAVVCQFNKNPYLTIFKTTDALATAAAATDYSENAQDLSTSTKVTLNSFDTAANNNFLFIGASVPFSGVEIDINNANANAATLTVKYWDGTSWTDTSASDGTTSGGATFAIDGNVTWSVPAAWITAGLPATMTGVRANYGLFEIPLFWTRWETSAAFDSTTDANSMIAINRSTAYAEIPEGYGWQEAVTVGPGGTFSITAKTDAGTANLIVNVATRQGGRF